MSNEQKTIPGSRSGTRIGISGNKGSFSEEAAYDYCRNNSLQGEMEYLISAENTLKSLDEGRVDRAIFPIENSNGGIVYEAVEAMSRYVFRIEKIFEIDIKHCLLVQPGTTSSQVNMIVSHQQAIKQCRMYLKRKWGKAELREYSDTAEAAKDLQKGELSRSCAVIAPQICADIYGLEVLEEGIQDLKFNFTSFIVAIK
jgi:prephenate dehydratase